jgi:acyl-CoA synthetase (AMP-forming)/AMP-acid ligase II
MICENAKDTSRSAREDILASAKAVLADYKVPERFEIAREIPRNGPGKIDRKLLPATMASAKAEGTPGDGNSGRMGLFPRRNDNGQTLLRFGT